MLAREGVQQNLTEYQCFVKCYASEADFSQELVAPTCALPLHISFSTENTYTDLFHKSGSISPFKPCAAEALRDFFVVTLIQRSSWEQHSSKNLGQVK